MSWTHQTKSKHVYETDLGEYTLTVTQAGYQPIRWAVQCHGRQGASGYGRNIEDAKDRAVAAADLLSKLHELCTEEAP